MQDANTIPAPDYTICPKQFCFFWQDEGDYIAPGFYPNVEEALQHLTLITKSGCGFRYGKCRRDTVDQEPNQVYKDFYEPCEPALDKAGLAHMHFVAPK